MAASSKPGPLSRVRIRSTAAEVMSLHRPENAQHIAQFYERVEPVIKNVGYLAAKTLEQGDSVVLIATPAHLEAMENRISAVLGDSPAAHGQRYLALDAAEVLATFFTDGSLDQESFEQNVGAAIARAIDASTNGFAFAFGEMVALLCAANRRDAALRLERMWNALNMRYRFSLYCAYPLSCFGDEPDVDALISICSEHSLAIPAETSR
jgi:hypothetical protein